jgi:hypothetical protein
MTDPLIYIPYPHHKMMTKNRRLQWSLHVDGLEDACSRTTSSFASDSRTHIIELALGGMAFRNEVNICTKPEGEVMMCYHVGVRSAPKEDVD